MTLNMKDKTPMRQCVVTRESLPKDDLMRLVLAPDSSAVLDLKNKLPGRGAYVQPNPDVYAQLTLKKLSSHFQTQVKSIPTQEDALTLIRGNIIGRLQLTKKANGLVIGGDEVQKAGGAVEALFVAQDAGKNALSIVNTMVGRGIMIVSVFAKEQLSAALNIPNCTLVGATGLDILRQNLHKYEEFLRNEEKTSA